MVPYDSRPDTEAHINRVAALLVQVQRNMAERGMMHDQSKLREPEKSMYDEWKPKLRTMAEDGPEIVAARAAMGAALQHHYAHNSHHPEHYPNGIEGMSLLDVLEMLCDWHAAITEKGLDFDKSLEINAARFGISPQLLSILMNTVREMGWSK